MKSILLHGMGQTASSWDKMLSFLPDKSEISCPELSGFFSDGGCVYDKMYSAFCEYCGTSEPLRLCGLSLGAVLALNYAVDFPQKVEKLILIAPQYKMPKLLLRVQNLMFSFMPESSFNGIGLEKNDFISLTNSMLDIDLTSRLGRVKCPVLVICGKNDKANKKAAIRLAKKLPDASFIEAPASGHEVNIDAPEWLAGAVKF